jgi:Xaa-Pro aminopeptidase
VPELLGAEAIAYLNSYHSMVCEKLSPYLDGEELEFLIESCESI